MIFVTFSVCPALARPTTMVRASLSTSNPVHCNRDAVPVALAQTANDVSHGEDCHSDRYAIQNPFQAIFSLI